MSPFWAVRRLTPQQLDKDIEACRTRSKTAVAGKEESIPMTNCASQDFGSSNVTSAAVTVCGAAWRTLNDSAPAPRRSATEGERGSGCGGLFFFDSPGVPPMTM